MREVQVCLSLLLISVQLAHGFRQPIWPREVATPSSSFLPARVLRPATVVTQPPRSSLSISSADGEEHVEPVGFDVEDLVDARKMVTTVGYRFSFFAFLILGLGTLVFQGMRTPMLIPSVGYFSAGPLLASGVAYVLEGAALNDRLGKDIYKRLNLYLTQYGALWLLASLLVCRSKPLSFGVKLLTNPAVLFFLMATVVNSFRAWTFGVKGWNKAKTGNENSRRKDLLQGIQQSIPVFFTVNNISGAVYLSLTVWMGTMQVMKLVELCQLVIDSSVTGTHLATRVLRYAKLALLTVVSFTLKDAADRNRLNFSSFLELNLILSFVMFTMAAYYYQIGLAFTMGAVAMSHSVFAGATGFLSLRRRLRKLRKLKKR